MASENSELSFYQEMLIAQGVSTIIFLTQKMRQAANLKRQFKPAMLKVKKVIEAVYFDDSDFN